jgi:hypothetical protein
VDGLTPHIDPINGNWFLGTTDTGVHAQGEQGIQGIQGESGVCNCNNGKMTICHVVPGEKSQTLELPLVAALKHLKEHELDTIGACPIENEE